MTFLVDANVLSEATKPQPAAKALEWLRRHEREIAVDPIILGEIRFGILRLAKGKRRARLERWFEEGIAKIACVPWESATGLQWAKLLVTLRSSGQSIPIKDSMIAATALTHNLKMVTRNKRDFVKAGLVVIDPFE